jgi:hypothetical protein
MIGNNWSASCICVQHQPHDKRKQIPHVLLLQLCRPILAVDEAQSALQSSLPALKRVFCAPIVRT